MRVWKPLYLIVGCSIAAVVAFPGSVQARQPGMALNIRQALVRAPDFGAPAYAPNRIASFQPVPYAVPRYGPVDCSIEACIALTFDDGPESATTPAVIDTLNRYGARGTFFVVGNRVAQAPDIVIRMHLEHHEVENHSWAHPDFRKLSHAQIREQIDKTQEVVEAAGVTRPRFFRPPYEFRTAAVQHAVDMPFILWNVDPKDWAHKDPSKLAREITESVKPGCIVVLHDTKETTLRALPQVLENLRGRYRFVTVQELLKLPATARGEFFSR